MPDKNKPKNLTDNLISGGISEDEYQELKNLVKDFPEYQDILDAHNIMMKAESPFEKPVPEQFTAMRQSVLRSIRILEMNTRSDWLSKVFG